jgi:cell division protein FtsB
MRTLSPQLLFAASLIIAMVVILAGDKSYIQLSELKETYRVEKAKTDALQNYVTSLQEKASLISRDNRFLEKEVRRSLDMGKDNELVFIFEDSGKMVRR